MSKARGNQELIMTNGRGYNKNLKELKKAVDCTSRDPGDLSRTTRILNNG
jgi:hypothetical protein